MMVRISLLLAVLRSKLSHLSQDANFPAVPIVEGLDEVLRAAAPAAQLRDEDGVDLVGSGQRQDLGALGACVVST
jgi:hypothetical protein